MQENIMKNRENKRERKAGLIRKKGIRVAAREKESERKAAWVTEREREASQIRQRGEKLDK